MARAYKVMVEMETSLRDDTYTGEYNGVAYADRDLAEIVMADARRECGMASNYIGAYVKEVDVPEYEVFVG